jgi:hypothetical protein
MSPKLYAGDAPPFKFRGCVFLSMHYAPGSFSLGLSH